jgi:pimeloyl-ACP methyl ester carboxylesterase
MTEFLPVFSSPAGKELTLQAYQDVLDRWTAPYEEIDVPTSFGETHVIASGPRDAPSILLLHAMFASATVWYRNAGALSEHYRIYAVDTLGEPGKSRPIKSIKSLEEYLKWFIELTDGLGVDEIYLVGNSVGAFLSTYFTMKFPDRIQKLVLIGPAATFHQIIPFYLNSFVPKMLYIFLPRFPGTKRLVLRGIDWIHNDLAEDPAWGPLFRLLMLHGTPTNQVFPRVYSNEEIAEIKIPTLLLIGDRERIYRPEKVIQIAKQRISHLETEIIPHAHHITALAQPEIVNARILKFFGGNGVTVDNRDLLMAPMDIGDAYVSHHNDHRRK